MTRRLLLVVLLAAAVVPYFVNLGATSIIDANEAFYSETPREMIEKGDWINSSFNYEPRFNKPPLSYWVVAGFYEAFGVSLGAARLPIALGMLVILATVFLVGRAAFSIDAGLVAALTLAATPRMLLFSRRIVIDVYTAMFVGLTLLCFVLAELDPARRRRWLAAMYVAVGLGMMTKGPVAAILPAIVIAAYLIVAGRLRTIGRMMLPAGVLIVAVIVVPYYAALYAQHGWAYISTFVFTENVARFAEGVGAPNRGPLFYVPVVAPPASRPGAGALAGGRVRRGLAAARGRR
jgi:4-amino-4-deoxy-L-arabinose transferase-like glycosyltransferase